MALTCENRRAPSFCSVPNEIKLLFADKLPISALEALSRTSWELNNLLTHYLYRRGMSTRPKFGKTFFCEAVSRNNLRAVKIFVDLGAKINMTGSDLHYAIRPQAWALGMPPLHMAIIAAKYDDRMARFLIDAGADISAPCRGFRSVLALAVWKGATSIVELLLNRGADPYGMDQDRRTLLHYAAIDGQPNMVQLLLRTGVNVEASDTLGRTALHYAAISGDVQSVQALLRGGANVMAADSFRNTPLLLAVVVRGSIVSARHLLQLGEKLDNAITEIQHYVAQPNPSTTIQRFLLDVGDILPMEVPTLNRILETDNIVRVLIDGGADIIARNARHNSALGWAALRNYSPDIEDAERSRISQH